MRSPHPARIWRGHGFHRTEPAILEGNLEENLQRLHHFGPASREQETWMTWIPVFFGLAVICAESTRIMGASHTGQWLQSLVLNLHLQSQIENIAETNHILRKTGHFCGYGLLGILFTRGWFALLLHRGRSIWAAARRMLRLHAVLCAIASTAAIASLDELHQSITPGRGASVWDVLLDTSGAVVLTIGFCLMTFLRRRQLCARVTEVRALLQRKRHRERFLNTLESLEGSRRQAISSRLYQRRRGTASLNIVL